MPAARILAGQGRTQRAQRPRRLRARARACARLRQRTRTRGAAEESVHAVAEDVVVIIKRSRRVEARASLGFQSPRGRYLLKWGATLHPSPANHLSSSVSLGWIHDGIRCDLGGVKASAPWGLRRVGRLCCVGRHTTGDPDYRSDASRLTNHSRLSLTRPDNLGSLVQFRFSIRESYLRSPCPGLFPGRPENKNQRMARPTAAAAAARTPSARKGAVALMLVAMLLATGESWGCCKSVN